MSTVDVCLGMAPGYRAGASTFAASSLATGPPARLTYARGRGPGFRSRVEHASFPAERASAPCRALPSVGAAVARAGRRHARAAARGGHRVPRRRPLFVGWLLYLTWPRLTMPERLMRRAVLVLAAGRGGRASVPALGRLTQTVLTIVLIVRMIVSMNRRRRPCRPSPAPAALAVDGGRGSCGSGATVPATRTADPRSSPSFYPLQFATAADRRATPSASTVLTKPGAEPHDLELTPQDVGA